MEQKIKTTIVDNIGTTIGVGVESLGLRVSGLKVQSSEFCAKGLEFGV